MSRLCVCLSPMKLFLPIVEHWVAFVFQQTDQWIWSAFGEVSSLQSCSKAKSHSCRCDIIHTHEWGGMASSLVIMNHLRQIHPGLRVVVEPHGGHVWSQLGEQNRPMDVGALRIDSYERVVNMLNDVEISPTNYMLSFLKQRGWQLPQKTLVIPNVVPDVDSHVLTPAVQKDVSSHSDSTILPQPRLTQCLLLFLYPSTWLIFGADSESRLCDLKARTIPICYGKFCSPL